MLAIVIRADMGRFGYAVAHELHRVIEHFVFIEQSAQRDDHILADHAGATASL